MPLPVTVQNCSSNSLFFFLEKSILPVVYNSFGFPAITNRGFYIRCSIKSAITVRNTMDYLNFEFQILQNFAAVVANCYTSHNVFSSPFFITTYSVCLSIWLLGQVTKWVMSGQ